MVTTMYALDKAKALQILNNFLEQFTNCCNQKHPPKADYFKNILSNDFNNSSSGKQIGKNMHDFINRVQDVQKKYSHIDIMHLNECLISGNHAIIHFDMHLTSRKGEKSTLNIMAIATIDGNLITHWTQVSHEKDKDYLHSA